MLNRRDLFRLRTLPYAALAIVACSSTGALAQGVAANGATLYAQRISIMGVLLNCQDCHGVASTFRINQFPGSTEAQILAGINGAIAANDGGMGAYSIWTPQQRSDVAAHILTAPVPPPSPPNAPLPTPTASPNTVMFGSTAVGATSPTVTVLVTNSATAAISLGNPAVSDGTGQVGDFRPALPPASVTACTSGLVLNPGMSCSVGAQFVPTAGGARTATWNVNFVGSATVPPRLLTLQGTATGGAAVAPGPAPAPTSSANAPVNAGAGALGWMQLLGLFALLGAAITRRR